MSSRARRGGGGFTVGRRRHVPVVDTGCGGCRPRRPRLLSLPSFLKPASYASKPAAVAVAVARSATTTTSRSTSSSFFFPSSSSTASFSTASHSSSNNYNSSHGYGAAKKVPPAAAASPAKRQLSEARKKKKRYAAAAEEEEGVGVAVEKESSDPRGDFRESMVQMVVEMGLCDWDSLRCMLRRLLALNAPRHHAAILTAFAEVCAQLAAPPPPPPPPYQYQR